VFEPVRRLPRRHHVDTITGNERQVFGGRDFIVNWRFPFRSWLLNGGKHSFRGICANYLVKLLVKFLGYNALMSIREVGGDTGPQPRSTAVPNGSR
jgi:hypothetical protein